MFALFSVQLFLGILNLIEYFSPLHVCVVYIKKRYLSKDKTFSFIKCNLIF